MNVTGLFKRKATGGKALKAGVGYTVGNFLVKGIAFLTLPLFSRLMTTAEFGTYNVFISFEAILYVIVGLAIHTSIQSANLEFKGANKYVSSVSLIYIINAAILSLIVCVFGSMLSKVTGFGISIMLLLVLYSFGTSMIQLYNNKIALSYDYKRYLAITVAYSVGSVIISLALMLTIMSNHRDIGRILGTTITVFLVALWILATFYKDARPKYNKEYWKFAVKYSLPIVPHGISQVLLAQFDRIMIRSIVSSSAAGIYSLATNIKLILTVITTSITTAWRTWFFQAIEANKIKEIQKRAGQLLEGYTILTIGLMSVSKEIILVIGGRNYESAKYVVIPMIVDAFILFIYSVIVQSEYYTKKTHYIMTGTMIAAVINVVTNYIFIHKYGFIAAAYTTLFSYVVYLILHLFISYKVVGFDVIKHKKLLLLLGLVTADAALNLVLVDKVIMRWIICFVIVLILGIHFANDTGALRKLKKGH